MLFQDASFQVSREIHDHKASPVDAQEDRVHRREDADQLARLGHVRLHEGLRGIISLCPFQSDKIPGKIIRRGPPVPMLLMCQIQSQQAKQLIFLSSLKRLILILFTLWLHKGEALI